MYNVKVSVLGIAKLAKQHCLRQDTAVPLL